ncbi:unnamed protein product [Trichobilharzia regenti]|uniref:Kinesin motor domain-containing protein n=1 Tax=Trichobilharzia regenti TaxID=157069 RepID=A0A183VRF2_TRIRE|nr:unnamed protein product [Trichobilharzia regenti]VDP98937.1 unnamed protein product [Trichobilharzia regenti]
MVMCCSPAGYNDAETKSTLMFGMLANTIKNLVKVNEEITAYEWRRRYAREREKVGKSHNTVSHLKSELKRWRDSETVNQIDWSTENQYAAAIDDTRDSITTPSVPSTPMLDSVCTHTPRSYGLTNASAGYTSGRVTVGASVASRASVEAEELQLLYKQLDEKDDAINKQA